MIQSVLVERLSDLASWDMPLLRDLIKKATQKETSVHRKSPLEPLIYLSKLENSSLADEQALRYNHELLEHFHVVFIVIAPFDAVHEVVSLGRLRYTIKKILDTGTVAIVSGTIREFQLLCMSLSAPEKLLIRESREIGSRVQSELCKLGLGQIFVGKYLT